MSNYKIAIPSYRLDVLLSKTLPLLIRGGIKREDIYIFVVLEEYPKYKDALPNINIIIGLPNVVKQRNFIRDYFNEGDYIISMDDDIEKISYISYGEFYDIDNLDDFFNFNHDFMIDIGAKLWGVYPVYNSYFISNQKEHISTGLNFIIKNLYGFINRKNNYFNLECDVFYDYENSILHYLKDGKVIRLNNVCCKNKKEDIVNKEQRYTDTSNDMLFLISKYPDIVRPKKKGDHMPHITLKKLPPLILEI